MYNQNGTSQTDAPTSATQQKQVQFAQNNDIQHLNFTRQNEMQKMKFPAHQIEKPNRIPQSLLDKNDTKHINEIVNAKRPNIQSSLYEDMQSYTYVPRKKSIKQKTSYPETSQKQQQRSEFQKRQSNAGFILSENNNNGDEQSKIIVEQNQQQQEDDNNDDGENQLQYDTRDKNQDSNKSNKIRKNGRFVSPNPNDPLQKKKKKAIWKPEYRIIHIDCPQIINQEVASGLGGKQQCKRRFKISYQYINDADGIVHRKTVKFGKIGVQEFIDHKDIDQRNRALNQMRNPHSPFHQNYWRYHLMNKTESMKENYFKLLTAVTKGIN